MSEKYASGHSSRPHPGHAFPAPALMVQGTTSDAGKSILCAALCRIFKEDGLFPTPFKAQNMTSYAYTFPDGARMGMAQVIQAWAAGREADVRMNPILLMPVSHTGSDVLVLGHSRGVMPGGDYFAYKPALFPAVAAAYNGLAASGNSLAASAAAKGAPPAPAPMILEGAGSPAEINLRDHDIVNMRMAEFANAKVILVGDIDRGGVFAGLAGTLALLEPHERDRVAGLVINKFRGDMALLEPGLRQVENITGKPVLGVIPHIDDLGLPEEDSLCGRAKDTWSQMSENELALFREKMDAALFRLARIVRANLDINYIKQVCLNFERAS